MPGKRSPGALKLRGRAPRFGGLSFGVAGWISLTAALVFVACAVAPGLIAPYDPLAVDPAGAFAPPSLAHPFGTDDSGRDVFSRVIYGARDSLTIGVVATLVGLILGLGIGVLAGGSRSRAAGPVRYVADRLIEALFSFPGLLLALLVIAVRGPGVFSIVLAVSLATAPGFARMIRGSIRQQLGAGPVDAARVQGDSPARVWFTLVLPETMRSVLVLATLGIGHAVILAAALGFLGLGSPPPTPEWGAMLNAGRPYLTKAWWMTVFPGLAIVMVGITATVLGRAFQRKERYA
ncbi:MAG: ABC transporter permease [Microbacteriaceae bacterium]|nr:ABC transporter permease [Microbacteriaceae bacterium]